MRIVYQWQNSCVFWCRILVAVLPVRAGAELVFAFEIVAINAVDPEQAAIKYDSVSAAQLFWWLISVPGSCSEGVQDCSSSWSEDVLGQEVHSIHFHWIPLIATNQLLMIPVVILMLGKISWHRQVIHPSSFFCTPPFALSGLSVAGMSCWEASS